jgi:hypothetical protein
MSFPSPGLDLVGEVQRVVRVQGSSRAGGVEKGLEGWWAAYR